MVTVITNRQIIDNNNYSNCCGNSSLEGDYSNLDANSSKDEIQKFQNWLKDKKGITLNSGKWDDDTAKYYLEYGIIYDLDNPNYVYNNTKPVTDLTNKYTLNKDLGNKDITKKGYYSKNFTFKPTPSTKYVPTENTKNEKGITKTTKILIGVGITLAVATIIYFIAKKK